MRALPVMLALVSCTTYSVPAADPDSGFAELARDYLFLDGDAEVTDRIAETIRELDRDDLEDFVEEVISIGGLSDGEAAIFRAANDAAASEGVSFLDLSPQGAEQVLAWADAKGLLNDTADVTGEVVPGFGDLGICFPGYVSCSTYTNYNANLAGASCAAGCVRGTSVDRRSNTSCELGRCDYRLYFPLGNANAIDGRTGAADCIILRHGTLLAYRASTYTYALFGGGTAALCGAVFPSASSFQVL